MFFRAPQTRFMIIFYDLKAPKWSEFDQLFAKNKQTQLRNSKRFATENAGKRRPFWVRLKMIIFRASNLTFGTFRNVFGALESHTFDTTKKPTFPCRIVSFVWKICTNTTKNMYILFRFWCQNMFQNSSQNRNFEQLGLRNWDF